MAYGDGHRAKGLTYLMVLGGGCPAPIEDVVLRQHTAASEA